MERPRIGVLFPATLAVTELPARARLVESLGLDEFWVVEDCFHHGGLTAAATALAVTQRVQVGIGLLPASVRNPAIVAMEIATLAQMYPDRLVAGFGHGVESWMQQIGARPSSRITALTEVITAVRSLLHGETISMDGSFVRLADVRLGSPPQTPPPIYVGSTGTLGLALACRKADGVILPEGTGEAALEALRERRGLPSTVVVYSWLRVDDDGKAARDRLVPMLAQWWDWGLFRNLFALARVNSDELADSASVSRMAVAGTPEDCARTLMRLGKAGTTSIVLAPIGEDTALQLERLADEVVPVMHSASLV